MTRPFFSLSLFFKIFIFHDDHNGRKSIFGYVGAPTAYPAGERLPGKGIEGAREQGNNMGITTIICIRCSNYFTGDTKIFNFIYNHADTF